MADDDYEPALDSPTDASVADPSEVAPAKIGAIPDDAVDDPGLGPRAPRVRSAASRAMFAAIVAKGGVGEETELEPMTTNPAPVTAPAAAAPDPVAAAPAAVPQPVVAALPPPPGMPELAALPPVPGAVVAPPDTGLADREAAIAAREAAMVEREKLLPDRMALAERPADAIMAWIKDVHGAADDVEMRTMIGDLVTELSERALGVKLPDEIKTSLESRRALRSVKAYKTSLDAREGKLAEQAKAQAAAAAESASKAEAQRREEAYVANIGQAIAPAKDQHPYLHDIDLTGGVPPQVVVYEVIKEQVRLGQKPDLAIATDYANKYFKSKFDEAQKLVARHAPPAAPKPAPTAPSPGAAPGSAATKPTPKPAEVAWDPSDLPMDRQQRRQASLKLLAAKVKAANPS